MNKTKLKKWLATAVDGGCSNAYRVLLNNLPVELVLKGKDIKAADLVIALHELEAKWEKEIEKVIN